MGAQRGIGLLGAVWASFLLALLTAVAAPAGAQPAPKTQPTPVLSVAQARSQLDDLTRRMGAAQTDDQLDDVKDKALALQTAAQATAQAEAPQLAALDTRLAQLGPEPKRRRSEAAAVRLERDLLSRRRASTDADIKQARLVAAAAGQLADQVAEQRRILFNERLFQVGDSPLGPSFWTDLGANLPQDFGRVSDALDDEAQAAVASMSARSIAILIAGAVVALLFLFPVRLALNALGRRYAVGDDAIARLKRSGLALWLTVVGAVTPGLAAYSLYIALRWSGALSPVAAEVAQHAVWLICWGAYVGALGRALLSVDRPAWRVAQLSDFTAVRIRPYPWIVALVTVAGRLLERVNIAVGASLSATVATNSLMAIVFALTAAGALVAAGRGRTRAEARTDGVAVASSVWSLGAVAVVAAIAAALLGVLAGYSALAVFVAGQIFWVGVVGASIFLLWNFVDDLCTDVVRPDSKAGRMLHLVFALRSSTIEQIGVLLSAALRLMLLFTGLSLVLSKFGDGAGPLLDRLRQLSGGVHVGAVVISPVAVAEGVAAFAFGVAAVRAVQSWLDKRYLPKTDWDLGLQNSVSTVVGYLGIGLAAACALASAGLGLQRVALIASALSVGIGFGLQAIVQNFISGLIMLWERPVKVGDWVVVGALEGDIQRINVRATEIKMADLSTLLVPNSEFVTKAVQNKTLGSPLGRIQIQIGIAPDADAAAARDILLHALDANKDVLETPAPTVFIDAVTVSGIQFNAFAYVSSPRAAYGVRSALFMDILTHLRAAKIELARAQQDLRLNPGPGFDKLGAITAPTPANAESKAPGTPKAPQA
jgi:small-conductance mechanosensitive channel